MEDIIKLSELETILAESKPDDWRYIPCHGDGGPSYVDSWSIYNEGSDRWGLTYNTHPHRATFEDDIRLTIAWGMELDEDMDFDWLNDAVPSMIIGKRTLADFECVDVFWSGELVSRYFYYSVPREHFWLPAPEHTGGGLEISKKQFDFIETVSWLEAGEPMHKTHTPDSVMKKAKIRLV